MYLLDLQILTQDIWIYLEVNQDIIYTPSQFTLNLASGIGQIGM